VDFTITYPELKLPFVKLWPPIQKLSAKHLLIPFPGPIAIADGYIDMLDQCYSGHGIPPSILMWDPAPYWPEDAVKIISPVLLVNL
jgi:hypothetical protein